jgi:SpoIIAA-like
MINTEVIAPGLLKIVAPEKLAADDFAELAPKVEAMMTQQGDIRLLIDASRLEGWENIAALENHAAFVKAHQQKVARIAVIARHEWQHWLVGAVKVFLHPDVRVFDQGEESAALHWLQG